jgi:RNA polymerase sigma-70 factor (ECF subfamily)
MNDSLFDTRQLHHLLGRMRGGDLNARDELLMQVCGRLERLARKMLRRFPDVHCYTQTGDVLQNAVLRLLRALQAVEPGSVRAFFGLAAEQMRRELLDLARRYRRSRSVGFSPAPADAEESASNEAREPADYDMDPAELERWCRFHQEVEKLPEEEREVVSLVYYHGWAQAEVADVLGVTTRTVRRRWQAAMTRLRYALSDTDLDE